MPPDPLILAFDTSVAHCAAALLRGDKIIAERCEPMARGQAERLLPLLEEILTEAGMRWRDLSALAVGTGPGNFTGIRISVAAARGLALALDIPALGVSGFEALADGLARPLCVLIDARRDQVFSRILTETGAAQATLEPADLARERATRQGLRLIGPGQVAGAAAIARCAARRLRQPGAFPRPAPFYVRAPDAAPPRDSAPQILP